MMNEKIKNTNKEKWLQLISMIFFYFIFFGMIFVILLISIFQFFSNVFFNKYNSQFLKLGLEINNYFYEIINFITFNTEKKPYPFSSWPKDYD